MISTSSIVVGIQARMGSSRLPGKSLINVVGKPLVHWVIDNVKRSELIDSVWLLTSSSTRDDPLVASVSKLVNVIRGDELDVRSRYRQLFETTGASNVVRVTGDCPFIDGELIDKLVLEHIRNKTDYCHIASQPYFEFSYPNGFNAEIFTEDAFNRMEQFGDSMPYKEHVTLSVIQHPKSFRYGCLNPPFQYSRPTWKLSVDTANDLNRIRTIAQMLCEKGFTTNIKNVIAICDEHPEWFE